MVVPDEVITIVVLGTGNALREIITRHFEEADDVVAVVVVADVDPKCLNGKQSGNLYLVIVVVVPDEVVVVPDEVVTIVVLGTGKVLIGKVGIGHLNAPDDVAAVVVVADVDPKRSG